MSQDRQNEHRFTTQGLSAQITGAGRRVVFVHGVGSYKESWDGVIEQLGQGYESLRYDLRGHGASAQTTGMYSLDMFCDDLAAVLREVAWDRFDLVGFSLGGLVAQAYALKYPAQVRSLGIVSSVADRTAQERERVLKRATDLALAGPQNHLAASVERWFSDDFRTRHPEIVQDRITRSKDMNPACFSAAYDVLASNDLIDRMHEITCPTLILTGEQDVGSTPRMARRMGEEIPHSTVHILPGLRHSILVEAPVTVGDLLSDFFAGQAN